ncbi:MAG: SagB/ThcOx family dehydrogenase [Acidobacteriota bacterium]
MTFNRETGLAWRYHDLTKHSYWSIRTSPHYLDWSNQPAPFKIYPSIDPIKLPVEFPLTGVRALDAIASPGIVATGEATPTVEQLASVLLHSAGVTKEKKYAGGSFYFRAAACAGALYPTEVYVVCRDIEGLAAGVYHFNPGDFSLRQLRGGDHRGVLTHATASEPAVAAAPVTLIYSAISFRSTWKYRDRAYRYHFWDNGMILANALAMATAHNLPAEVVLGFVDSEVNRLIGIDGQSELPLSLLALGHTEAGSPAARPASELAELNLEVIPPSPSPVDYPSMREMQEASSLVDENEVRLWRESGGPEAASNRAASIAEPRLTPLLMPSDDQLPEASLEAVIERRGSTRRFARKQISFAHLSIILDRATRDIPFDCVDQTAHLNELYMIVNRVEGLEPGAYFYRRDERALEQLKPGDFSEKASYLVLEQELGGDASVTIFFMADLESVLARLGNRGYRTAQLEAGIIGGKIYVAAYSLGRGATGLTFFDDDVTEFFSPHAEGKSCMLVVSVGVPGKRLIY